MRYENLRLILEAESAHKKIIDMIKPNTTILEIGTGHGHMSQYLAESLACTIDGIELDPKALGKAAPFLRRAISLDVNRFRDLDELLDDDSYDYIVLADVIEHLYYTEEILSVIKKKVKNTGFIILSIPNASHNLLLLSLINNDFSYTRTGYFDSTHIKWFTSDSFKRIFENVGLKLDSHSYTYMTPEYEDVKFNSYNSVGLLAREVLLSHRDGHFFQNIFVLKKSEDSVSTDLISSDCYWFDRVDISCNGEPFKVLDVFDQKNVIDIIVPTNGIVEVKPTFRMRGVTSIIVSINSVQASFSVSGFYTIGDVLYSLDSGIISLNHCMAGDQVRIEIEYREVNEAVLNEVFSLASSRGENDC